jgi:hypothetical protein
MIEGLMREELCILPLYAELVEPLNCRVLQEDHPHNHYNDKYDFHQGPFFFEVSDTIGTVFHGSGSKNGFSNELLQGVEQGLYTGGIGQSKVKRKSGN